MTEIRPKEKLPHRCPKIEGKKSRQFALSPKSSTFLRGWQPEYKDTLGKGEKTFFLLLFSDPFFSLRFIHILQDKLNVSIGKSLCSIVELGLC